MVSLLGVVLGRPDRAAASTMAVVRDWWVHALRGRRQGLRAPEPPPGEWPLDANVRRSDAECWLLVFVHMASKTRAAPSPHGKSGIMRHDHGFHVSDAPRRRDAILDGSVLRVWSGTLACAIRRIPMPRPRK
jgi:hypothetical protein